MLRNPPRRLWPSRINRHHAKQNCHFQRNLFLISYIILKPTNPILSDVAKRRLIRGFHYPSFPGATPGAMGKRVIELARAFFCPFPDGRGSDGYPGATDKRQQNSLPQQRFRSLSVFKERCPLPSAYAMLRRTGPVVVGMLSLRVPRPLRVFEDGRALSISISRPIPKTFVDVTPGQEHRYQRRR